MPRIDFSAIDEAGSYEPIPEGEYRVRVDDVEESTSRHGDEMWKVAFAVLEGDHEGRKVFDNIVFSEKALPRVKLICSRLGLDTSAVSDLTPDMLLDRTCLLTVEIHEYTGANGSPRLTNGVPFGGYEHDPRAGEHGESDDGALPF